MDTCRCGQPIPPRPPGKSGPPRKWCTRECMHHHLSADRAALRTAARRLLPPGSCGNRITEKKIAEVKAMFPSCARDWDAAMVDKAWPRLAPILARRLERIDARA